jgi:hypothetical protein
MKSRLRTVAGAYWRSSLIFLPHYANSGPSRAKPSDNAARIGSCGPAHAGATGWSDGSVGHSFSGMIVTEAGMHPNVSALVYVAARAPDAVEDYAALAKTFPTPPASAGVVFDGDEGRLSEAAFLHDFAGDLPEAKAKVLCAVQEPFQKAPLTGKITHAAWQSKPSFYAVSTEDRTINPDLERFMAKRMGTKTIEVKASHLSPRAPASPERRDHAAAANPARQRSSSEKTAGQLNIARGSRNASRPNVPYSRPMPDCLKPPNGASGSCGAPLMTTRPACNCAATCFA